MPKNKSHKGLLKRIKITKTGKIRFRAPASRHLKSNKTGTQVQSYRKNRYARAGNLKALSKMLFRPLRSEEQHEATLLAKEASCGDCGCNCSGGTK
jgi:large subunit ribosomal protein L35